MVTMRWMVEGGKPVREDSSRIPTLPASATASIVSMAFKRDFISPKKFRLVFKPGRMKILKNSTYAGDLKPILLFKKGLPGSYEALSRQSFS